MRCCSLYSDRETGISTTSSFQVMCCSFRLLAPNYSQETCDNMISPKITAQLFFERKLHSNYTSAMY